MEGKDRPEPLGQKEYNKLGKTAWLMSRMCRPIFGSGKAVLLDSGFCVATSITEIEAKGVYAGSLINKRLYWPEGVPGDLIDTHFEDKEVGDVGMIESRTEDRKLFIIFCMKLPDYVMKIMASWMTLDELEGVRSRQYFIDRNGTKETNQFTYQHPFGINFRYRHQVDDHNNCRHAHIFLVSTWVTKFWPGNKFAWYLAVL